MKIQMIKDNYLIFDYVHIEIGGRRILFSLSSQKGSQSRHVEIKKCDLSSSLRSISENHQHSSQTTQIT